MDVHRARDDERMLRRVIALVVAFAILAERVANRSLAVRWFVLWILRRAETAAGAFFFEQAGMPPPVLVGIAAVGNDPSDAMCLATRFHALAAALRALLPSGYRFGRRPARRGFASGPMTPDAGRRPGGWARKPYDTS